VCVLAQGPGVCGWLWQMQVHVADETRRLRNDTARTTPCACVRSSLLPCYSLHGLCRRDTLRNMAYAAQHGFWPTWGVRASPLCMRIGPMPAHVEWRMCVCNPVILLSLLHAPARCGAPFRSLSLAHNSSGVRCCSRICRLPVALQHVLIA
jgi:hypothetical protein